MMLLYIFTVLILLLVWRILTWYRAGQDLPPGAPTLPLIGAIPFLGKNPIYEYASDLDKQYNNPGIVSIRINEKIFILVNNWAMAKELFVNRSDLTSERPHQIVAQVINPSLYGLVNARFPKWELTRRFSLRVLRDFGVGRSKVIDGLIMNQLTHLEESFDEHLSSPMDPSPFLHRAVGGIICSLLFGQPADQEDKSFDGYLHDTSQFLGCSFRFLVFFPFTIYLYRIRALLPYLPHGHVFVGYWRVMDFLQNKIDEHRKSLNTDIEPCDFVDAFLHASNNPKRYNLEDTNMNFDDANLRQLIFELFLAGSDTTYMSLRWGMLLLSYHEDIQERMYQEIHDLAGSDRLINFVNADELNYTRAVVHEVLRFGNVAGVSLPHTALKDIRIGGHRVPKDCFLFTNIYHCLRDEAAWKNPKQFDPENFLNEKNEFVSNDAFNAFSLGRRVCPGESLARNEVFVFLSSIIQKYRLKLVMEPGDDIEALLKNAKNRSVVRSPADYKIVIERRV